MLLNKELQIRLWLMTVVKYTLESTYVNRHLFYTSNVLKRPDQWRRHNINNNSLKFVYTERVRNFARAPSLSNRDFLSFKSILTFQSRNRMRAFTPFST